MASLARVMVSAHPHHLTRQANRRQETFLCGGDYPADIDLMGPWCTRCEVVVWAYCLAPGHVHVIVVPAAEDGLRRADPFPDRWRW